MATSFKARTHLYNTKAAPASYSDAESFEEGVPEPSIAGTVSSSLSERDKESLLLSTYMSSRGGWATEAAERLCRMARTEHLAFIYGERSPFLLWRLPIGTTDAGKAHAFMHGYLLNQLDIKKVIGEIDHLFSWSLKNIELLADDDFLGYFAYADGIRDAITKPVASSHPSVDPRVAKGEDGDGPWYLYSWLYSIRQVLLTAQIAEQDVLHSMRVSAGS